MKNPLGEPLPPAPTPGAEDYDPRAYMVARLLAYEKLRRAAEFLQSGGVRIRGVAWERAFVPVEIPAPRPQKPQLDADKLADAFGRIMGKTPPAKKIARKQAAAASGRAGRRSRYGSPLVVKTGQKTASGKPAKITKPGCTMIVRLPENWRLAAKDLAAKTNRTTNEVVLRGLAREFIAAGYPLPTDPPMANPEFGRIYYNSPR